MQHVQHPHPSNAGGSSDTAAILGMFAFGVVAAATALLIAARFLMNLPALLGAEITFSLIVFFLACGVALLMRRDPGPARNGPPVLVFRDLSTRRERSARPADPAQHPDLVARR